MNKSTVPAAVDNCFLIPKWFPRSLVSVLMGKASNLDLKGQPKYRALPTDLQNSLTKHGVTTDNLCKSLRTALVTSFFIYVAIFFKVS